MARWVCTRCTKLYQDTIFDRGPPEECSHCSHTEFDRIGEPRQDLPDRIRSIGGFVRVCQGVVALALLIAIVNGFQRNVYAASWGGATAVAVTVAALVIGRRTTAAWGGSIVVFAAGLLSSGVVLSLIDWSVLPSVTILVGLNAVLFVAGIAVLLSVRSQFT